MLALCRYYLLLPNSYPRPASSFASLTVIKRVKDYWRQPLTRLNFTDPLSGGAYRLVVSGKQTPSGGRGERSDIGSGHDELL
jgi:hypothetical protein